MSRCSRDGDLERVVAPLLLELSRFESFHLHHSIGVLTMKWTHHKSRLKKWIARHRHSDDYSRHPVLSLFPKKIGYSDGATVFWLSPFWRIRKSSSWDSKGFLNSGFFSWWDYEDPGMNIWSKWLASRPMHHFAGLVYLLVYWSWYPSMVIALGWYTLSR